MSKPMLPGQNSKYWGLDLNNYLLSLDRKISSLESFHSLQSTVVQNIGPGFLTGSWDLTTPTANGDEIEFLNVKDYRLNGTITYETYRDGNINYIGKTIPEEGYKIFDKFSIIKYEADGRLEYPNNSHTNFPNDLKDSNKTFPYNCAFYAVYLFCELEADGSDTTITTVLCPNYIFRGDCIMIGSYETEGGVFTPRVQTSSKTLYQSGQDTIHSYATVEYGCSSDRLPLANSKDNNNIYDFKKFYYYSNGVSPSEILSNIKDSDEKFTNRSYDAFSQTNIGNWQTYLVSTGGSISSWTGAQFEDGKLAAYYLAPSGNIYVQIHAGPTNYPIEKDYNMEAIDPLRDKEGFVTGGLVFIGTVFKQLINSATNYIWTSARFNGISPTLLDINRVNPHKILIENNQYWVGNTWYNIDIDENNNGITLKKSNQDIGVVILNNRYAIPSGRSILFYPNNTAPQDPRPEASLFTDFSTEAKPIITLTTYEGGGVSGIERKWKFKQENGEFETNQLLVNSNANIGSIGTSRLIVNNNANLCNKIKINNYITADLYPETGKATLKNPIINNENYKAYLSAPGIDGADRYFVIKEGSNTIKEGVYNYKYTAKTGMFELYDSLGNPYNTATLSYYSDSIDVIGNTSITGDVSIVGGTSIVGNTSITGDTTITGKTKIILPEIGDNLMTVYLWDDEDTSKVFSYGINGFKFFGSVSCTDITFTSDIRLKTNLKPINSKICHNAVQNLNVNTYTYTRNNYDTLGLIAQEIEEQLPEYAHLLVHENEDGEKMVSEHKLLFILWEALKQEIKERKGGK